MTVYSLLGDLIRFMSWLCFEHQWAKWELLTIAVIPLFLLLLILRLRRKGTVRRIRTNQLQSRSPIVGVKITDSKRSRQGIKGLEKNRLANVRERQSRQSKELKKQIKQLKHEITKHKQIEVDLEQQVAELKAAHEQFQHEVTKGRQADEHLKKQLAELTAAHEQLQLGRSEKAQVESSKQRLTSERRRMPLNIEELTNTTDLSKGVSGRLRN
ncbi:MAG: hypothetical protein ACYTFW_23285 [Planctomycetota bacterium]|jgi:chromosome segregation ATPase